MTSSVTKERFLWKEHLRTYGRLKGPQKRNFWADGTDAVGDEDADLSISPLAESHSQGIHAANTRPPSIVRYS